MVKYKTSEVFYEHDTGRWMCPTTAEAYKTMDEHPGENIYTYEYDHNNHITNIQPFWTSNMIDRHRMPNIRRGHI